MHSLPSLAPRYSAHPEHKKPQLFRVEAFISIHVQASAYNIERPFLAAVRKRRACNLMKPAASF